MISFTKTYPHFLGWDDEKNNPVIDKDRPSQSIHYAGIWVDDHYEGSWELPIEDTDRYKNDLVTQGTWVLYRGEDSETSH